jgi:hypothetical protein
MYPEQSFAVPHVVTRAAFWNSFFANAHFLTMSQSAGWNEHYKIQDYE